MMDMIDMTGMVGMRDDPEVFGECPRCGNPIVEVSHGRFGCAEACGIGPEAMRATVRNLSRTFRRERINERTKRHTARMNNDYNLEEPFWPSFLSDSDYAILSRFCWLDEHVQDDETARMRHVRQRAIFALWDEIEHRALYFPFPQVRKSYPWEGVPNLRPMPALDDHAAVDQWMEEVDSDPTWAYGSGSRMGASPGRSGKVGYNNTADEENMGLYRREGPVDK
jgi:hypothetical protein